MVKVVLAVAAALVLQTPAATSHATSTSLSDAYATIAAKQFVDLTHDFDPQVPDWPCCLPETVSYFTEGLDAYHDLDRTGHVARNRANAEAFLPRLSVRKNAPT